MSKDRTSSTTRAVRPGRQLVLHLFLASLFIGGVAGYWFLVKGQAENTQTQKELERSLDTAHGRLESRLSNIELVSSIIGSSILANGSQRLVNSANALPQSAVENSGLVAISWWPRFSTSLPRYLIREGQTWLEHDIGGRELRALAQGKSWFLLAPQLAANSCLWSNREREAVTGQLVLSCSRAVIDSRQRFLGVLRYSYQTTAFDNLLARVSPDPIMLTSSSGAYLASNTPRLSDVRSLAEVGQRLPALSPLATAIQSTQDENLRKTQAAPEFPATLAEQLVAAELESDINRASTALAAAMTSGDSLRVPAMCVEGWCSSTRAAKDAPWILTSIGELPSVTSLTATQISRHLPLIVFGVAMLAFALLSYTMLVTRWMRPLARLVAPLSRLDPGPSFDENLRGEWGQIASALNQMAENNERLRAQLLGPRQATRQAAPSNAPMSLDLLPVSAIIVDSLGIVQEANQRASSMLDLSPGSDSREIFIEHGPGNAMLSLAAIPDDWIAEPCRFRAASIEGAYGISTSVLGDAGQRLILLSPQAGDHANASADGITSATSSATNRSRQALAALTAPVHWLSLEVGPEVVPPALTDSAAQEHFREQLAARIDDCLESGEMVLQWAPGHFIIAASRGVNAERADEIRQALQSSLIFLASERVRLKASTALFTVRPHMNSQDFDAAIYAASREARGDTKSQETRSYDNATVTRLIKKGFQEKRFQLITEHGLHPGVKDDAASAFRVLPHLEDDEGFWMGAREYMPALRRLRRQGEHDGWLIEAVHAGLTTLSEKCPEQVLLPLCGQTLGSAQNEVAEKLASLARDPALADSMIYVALPADETYTNGVDLNKLSSLIHSLGCRLALTNLGMDTQSMGQLERVRPDMMVIRESLVHAALDSPIIGIGLESLIRAGDKLKCSTVLPGINNDRARQLVDKLHPSLAFGFAIGKPSPLPFRAVA